VTWNNGIAVQYVNAKETDRGTVTLGGATANGTLVTIGCVDAGSSETFMGSIDEVRIYDTALTADALVQAMTGDTSSASAPQPAAGTTDVPRDVTLSWQAGAYAATHNVYLGTTFADVDAADTTKPQAVSKGQTGLTYKVATPLQYGQTYYWRVDEVNAPPSTAVAKGSVWSFTVEPYAYPIPGTSIEATASSSQNGMGPENTINGSGLTGDLHGTDGATMWLSSGTPPNWIQYQFDNVYKLYDLKVWNSNQMIESLLGFGAKDVKIEYSTDGTSWTALANAPQFAKAPGAPGYAANTTVDFGGVMAKYVKLTINANWGGITPVTGLSEVRFSYVSVQARTPQPAAGATGVSVGATLTWRPGREAGSHKVFLGTDQAAVTNGTATAQTVTDHSFSPASLLFGTTYYWRVDEVNTVTYPGAVWSFTTLEFAAVDDFEAYNDTDNRVYDTWIDGLTDGKSGSTVGYMTAPFAEQTIVHGGKQSMPLAYDNSKSPFYSETTRDLGTAQDWTGNGATHMDLWFRGYPVPATVAITSTGNAMTLTGDGTDIWNASDDFTFAYKTLTGDGTMVARVVSVGTGTNTWAKGGVMIRQSLNGGSTFADTVITAGGGNGASFQERLTTDSASPGNADAAAVLTAPYWVKIQRVGTTYTGYLSADGKTWTQQGTAQAITMTDPVLIGICVTAHQAGEQRTMQFDNITTTGNVTGAWQGAVVNSPQYNAAAGLYVVVQDNAGKSKLFANADPAAAATGTWTRWTIPLSDLTAAGVKTTKVQKITIGVGSKTSPAAGGTGTIYIDDIGVGHPLN
jgi:hypothetical protein